MTGHRPARHFWHPDEEWLLELLYEGVRTEDLAKYFGRPVFAVYQKAHALGLYKSADFLERLNREAGARLNANGFAHRFKKGLVPANKGLRRPGWARGRMAETQFKKGQVSAKWMPVGSERLVDGYRYTKVTDIRNVPWTRNWRPTHVLLWEATHGPIPPGHALVFKNRDKGDIREENLELITRAELMARNTLHNLPKPLAYVVQLRGALNRQINKKNRELREAAAAGARP